MAMRSIELRWHGRCCICRAELGVHQTAAFDDVAHTVTCARCAEADQHVVAEPAGGSAATATPRAVQRAVAARCIAEMRRQLADRSAGGPPHARSGVN